MSSLSFFSAQNTRHSSIFSSKTKPQQKKNTRRKATQEQRIISGFCCGWSIATFLVPCIGKKYIEIFFRFCLSKTMRVQLLFVGSLAGFLAASCQAFVPSQSKVSSVVRGRPSPLRALNDEKDEAAVEEDVRLKIYESRRRQIRASLKSAESLRNFRLEKGTNNIFDLSV
jgi:hypothetical protein